MNKEQFIQMKRGLIDRLNKDFQEHWKSAEEYNKQGNKESEQCEIGIATGICLAIRKIEKLRFEY